MTNPFSADNGNPFQSPYKAPENPASSGSTIKPFAGKDLNPLGNPGSGEMKTQGQSNLGQSGGALGSGIASGPSASPFLDRNFGAGFPAAPSTSSTPMPIAEPLSPQIDEPETHSFAAFAEPTAPFAMPAQPHSGASSGVFSPTPDGPFRPTDFTGTGSSSAGASGSSSSQGYGSQALARKSQIMPLADMDRIDKPEFFVTTSTTVQGYTIEKYLGIISVEVVVPKDLLFRNPAPHGDLHRLKAAEDELQRVRVAAIKDLEARGRDLNADGIIGVTLQFSQFDTIVCLCSAVGTAIRLVG